MIFHLHIRGFFWIFWYFKYAKVISQVLNSNNLGETNYDYVCAGIYYNVEAVKKKHDIACDMLHNAKPDQMFPSHLKETQIFGTYSEALFTWPITSDSITLKNPIPRDARIVINLSCKFFGLITNGDSGPKRCTELLANEDEMSSASNLEEFKGFKCGDVIFEDSYLEKSLIEANRAKPIDSFNHYPRTHQSQIIGHNHLEWPIFRQEITFKPSGKNPLSRDYFLVFSKSNQPMKVVEVHKKIYHECKRYRRTKVTSIIPSGFMNAPVRVHKGMDQTYNCKDINFEDYYIQSNKERATYLHGTNSPRKGMNDKYPGLVKGNGITLEGKVWQWPLRIPEQKKKKLSHKTSYMLFFDDLNNFLGTYYLEMNTFRDCRTDRKSVV